MTDRVPIPTLTQAELDAIYRLRAGTHVLVPVEIDRLWQALSWISDHDPQLVDEAEKRFEFSVDRGQFWEAEGE